MSPHGSEEFFLMYEHAPWSYDPERETPEEGRAHGALRLAQALQDLREDDEVIAVWEVESAGACAELHEGSGPFWLCELWLLTQNEPVHSLGCIDLDGDPQGDPYARVIEAELYTELTRLRGEAS